MKEKEEETEKEKEMGLPRRDFFSKVGWGTFAALVCGSGVATARFAFPNVLFEPPMSFKAGFPDEYQVGEVSTKWIEEFRVWLVREEKGFYAILANCTHLGCTPNWLESENKFKCPCHGSGFHKDGINFEGPAPRPLERLRVSLADDGQILIDKSRVFRQEFGEWDNPDAFLKV